MNKAYRMSGEDGGFVVATDEALFFTDDSESATVNDPAAFSHRAGIYFSSVKEVTYNTRTNYIEMICDEENGKEITRGVELRHIEDANKCGGLLGAHLGTVRIESQENKVRELLVSSMYLIGVIALTWFLTTLESDDFNGGNARRRGIIRLARGVFDFLGTTGIVIVGGLIAAFITYSMFKRFNDPAVEVSYKRA